MTAFKFKKGITTINLSESLFYVKRKWHSCSDKQCSDNTP